MKPSSASGPPHHAALPPARTALRDLYRTARHLQHSEPYAAARLTRLTDQAEYFLQSWPAAEWPASLHTALPLPAQATLLAWITTAKREAAAAGPGPWSYLQWRKLTTILLAALAPFA